MDKSSLPQWGWLLIGLFVAAILAQLINLTILAPLGVPESYWVITTTALMVPVLVYIGVWYEDDRQEYWEHSTGRIAGDLLFVVTGATLSAAMILVVLVEMDLSRLLTEITAIIIGFVGGWAVFWWRNLDLYRNG